MVGRRGALRLPLLVPILAGVFGMHTLGHPSSHPPAYGDACHGTATHAPAAHAPPAAHGAAMGVVDVVAVGVCMTMDPSDACLAIVSALGMAVLLAAALAGAGRAGHRPAPADGVTWAAGRGPPVLLRVGLRLADLSVSRT